MRERPQHFRLNRYSSLAERLVFAGLGGRHCVGSALFADSSDFGNHGTLTNMDPATDWVFDTTLGRSALDVTAAQYVPTLLTLPATDAFSLSIWAAGGSQTTKYLIDNSAGTIGFIFRSFSDQWEAYVWFVSGENIRVAGGTLDGAWHHLALVWSRPNLKLYQDGVAVDTAVNTAAMAVSSTPVVFGAEYDGTDGFAGQFADPLVWLRSVTLSEISKLADPSNVMLSGLILPPARRLWPVAVSGGESDLILPHHGMMAM